MNFEWRFVGGFGGVSFSRLDTVFFIESRRPAASFPGS
jgi:hypothetical protein